MQTAAPIIRTKLNRPFLRKELVPRPRLQERIEQGLRGPLTLITAPAGFGKTTLAAASIARCGIPAAWLSLDKNDNQEGRFLCYLTAALQAVDPTIGDEAAQLLAAPQPPQPESVLTSLINDLDRAAAEIILVLDDYQFISSRAVHETVVFLLEHCPESFHLVIATRSDPPLPLTRWRVRSQMVELRAADLRFSESEAAQFLNEIMGLRLDAESIALLEKRTEGWIAGLQMAALSMRDRKDIPGFIEGFSGSNRYILDYLLEEVLSVQPPEIQHFLLRTSILERMTAPLCDCLLSMDPIPGLDSEGAPESGPPALHQSASVLAYMERVNLFLVPLDDERTWYRYHHLFADLLRAQLHQTQLDLVPDLHIRAAAWLEENETIPEAIQHLFAAREIEQAAHLIERYGPALLAKSDPSVFWMANRLPKEMILARPKIGLHQAWLLITQGRIPEATQLLNDLSKGLAGSDLKSDQRWMQTIVSLALAFLAPPSSTQKIPPLPDARLLDEIPEEERILCNAANYLYAMTLHKRGEFNRAVEFSVKNIQREETTQEAPVIPTLAPFLTRIYVMQGLLQAAASLCCEYLDPIKKRGIRFIYTAGSMKIDFGLVLYEWNRLEEAEQYIRDGLQDNEPWGNIRTGGFGLAALARVLQARGDDAGALQAAEKFEGRLLEHSRPTDFEEDFRTLRVRVQLASGDLQNPASWADQITHSGDYGLYEEIYKLTLAHIRFAQGKYAEVEKMLTGFIPPESMGSWTRRQLESNLLLAASIARQQRLPQALGLIEDCLALAEPEGYLRVFLDLGKPARELLAAYLRSDNPVHQHYAQKVLDAFAPEGETGSPSAQPGELIEPLSAREMEVLQLMALGMTNQEIAQQLVIAPGTVKAHTASIYRKLDVANRTEAAARARQFGILH